MNILYSATCHKPLFHLTGLHKMSKENMIFTSSEEIVFLTIHIHAANCTYLIPIYGAVTKTQQSPNSQFSKELFY